MTINLNISAVLCCIAGIYSIYVLIRYLHIFSRFKPSCALDVMPVVLGALAWITAGIEFLSIVNDFDSQIEIQRAMMVVAWCWLISRHRNN